jgi:hypothetical protein
MARFAFIFPPASGHFNASVPVAKSLVGAGHAVHYLSQEPMRAAVEGAGAVFHSDIAHKVELYTDERGEAAYSPLMLVKELGLEAEHPIVAIYKTGLLMEELSVPGVLRWLHEVEPDVIFYNPELCAEVSRAAKTAGLPSVGLVTLAGPGGMEKFMLEMLTNFGLTPEHVITEVSTYRPAVDAAARMTERYGEAVSVSPDPLGKMNLKNNAANFVTTIDALQDPMSSALAEFYAEDGVGFEYVGPLSLESSSAAHEGSDDVIELVRAARSRGRSVVLVSMGTGIPSLDCWDKRPASSSNDATRGLTNGELCRAVWHGAFEAFGAAESAAGPLIVLSAGPHPGSLEGLEVPPNAICRRSVPQADILSAGVDVFLTHGGQNSFMEALSNATPLVVCPGDCDQPINARKAVAIGVGLKVDRPDPDQGSQQAAAAQYSEDVCQALRTVVAESTFRIEASRAAETLRAGGGVERVVAGLLDAAGSRAQ